MPVTPTYPGVYIEEIPSGVRTITGVATSITAFIGRARRGPVNDPVRVQNFGDYVRSFGGLWQRSTMSYAVQQYFLNGGTDAICVRVHNYETPSDDRAALSLTTSDTPLVLEAANPGDWGNRLRAYVDHDTKEPSDTNLFNLFVQETDTATPNPNVVREEVFRNVSIDDEDATYLPTVLEQESTLVRVSGAMPDSRPIVVAESAAAEATGGSDGNDIVDNDISLANLKDAKQGLWSLEKTDLFNLMCIPPLTRSTDVGTATWTAALAYCKERRAMLIIDPPASWDDVEGVEGNLAFADLYRDENAAVFFPRLNIPDALKDNRLQPFVPCGVVAGIFARTDANRGVWKAPAGIEATLAGVRSLTYKSTDAENGRLNPLGINCIRNFPVIGNVVWGARTLRGADLLASEWKYIPVRRLAMNIEESLYRGSQWVVFEPNDEPLWAQIRLSFGAFMHGLFRQGAFQGKTPREAYLVKCDKETTTQYDIDRGIVNILVGFAPLKPAEFVIIQIQQLAGQNQA